MQIIRALDGLHAATRAVRTRGETLALVPTMGALHDGHLALVRAAALQADRVLVSIFVNPTQFGPNEDLATYPRQEEADCALLAEQGVALVWLPDAATMYPPGHATHIHVAGLGDGLCGATRPGHFDGVATVVAKLFNQVRPDCALFGEKDWQQLSIIRRMTRDLDLPVEIIGVPTVREADGLARSSRNAYLSADERRNAGALPAVLTEAARRIGAGEDAARVLTDARQTLLAAGFDTIDYFELRDSETLAPITGPGPGARLFAAARMGRTRLIDNWRIGD